MNGIKAESELFSGLIILTIFYMTIIIYLHPINTNGFILAIAITLPLAIIFRFLSELRRSLLSKIIAYIWLIILIVLQLCIILPALLYAHNCTCSITCGKTGNLGTLPAINNNRASQNATQHQAITPNSIHAQYDIFFQNNATCLNVNVKAIAQTENSNLSSGYGPAYLLNGLTNNGYWYQVGFGYNFNYTDNKNVDNYSGFRFIYEVWNVSTDKPLNIGCGYQACVKNFVGVVNNNDTILLNMSIIGNKVILSAYDTNTTARSPTINITSYGARFFTSNLINETYFSGLMTEWRCIGETNFTQRSVYSIIYPKTNIMYYISIDNETNNLCKQQVLNKIINPSENVEQCGTQLYYYLNHSITINGSVRCPC